MSPENPQPGRLVGGKPSPPEGSRFEVLPPREEAAQAALAGILRDPSRSLVSELNGFFTNRQQPFDPEALVRARSLVEDVLGTGLRTSNRNEPTPVLVDRLSFGWRLLRQADKQIWKLKKGEIPARASLEDARRVLWPTLQAPIAQSLLVALLEMLRLEPDAKYLFHYWAFRKAKSARPEDLPAPLCHAVREDNVENLRRVILWILRSYREQYVEVRGDEPVSIEFGFLVEETLKNLRDWFGAEFSEAAAAEVVEDEVNQWLAYSHLQERETGAEAAFEVDRDVARAFIRQNELNKTFYKQRGSASANESQRERELRAQLQQYIDENRSLEERLRQAQTSSTRHGLSVLGLGGDGGTLVQVLRTIDAKYSFDMLNAIQLGDETHLTLRSFVTHLIYGLRKQGLVEYPGQSEFDLAYEESGLYDCEGFEVQPSSTIRVRVVRRGWAVKGKAGLTPIRRAKVTVSEE